MIENEKKNNTNVRKKQEYKFFVGTPNYMPVESVRNKGVSKATDTWSLGCILYQLFVGFPPFIGGSEYLIFQKSIEAKYIFPKGIINEQAKDLIQNLLKLNPEERLNINQINSHSFLKDSPNNYPVFDLKEIAYEKLKTAIIKKYENEGKVSLQIKELEDNIKSNKEKFEELQSNPDRKEDNEKFNELLEKDQKLLSDLKEKFDIIKKNLDCEIDFIIDDLNKCTLLEGVKKEMIISKFEFLKKQIYHDIFNILFDY